MSLPEYIDLSLDDLVRAARLKGEAGPRYQQEWLEAGTIVEGRLRLKRADYLALWDRWQAPAPGPVVQATMGKMGSGLSRALYRWARGGFRWLSGVGLAIRVARCVSCPHRLPGPPERCALCGCGLRLKRRLPAERCPEGRW